MSKRAPRNFLESVQQAPWDKPGAREKLAREAVEAWVAGRHVYLALSKSDLHSLAAAFLAFAESVEKMR